MKKLLLTTTIILGLASCEFKAEIEDYRVKERLPFSFINHFEYKGHDYIFFNTGSGKCSVGGVVHDPDCRCNKAKEETK